MRGRNQSAKRAVRGEEFFVRIDVHKESWIKQIEKIK